LFLDVNSNFDQILNAFFLIMPVSSGGRTTQLGWDRFAEDDRQFRRETVPADETSTFSSNSASTNTSARNTREGGARVQPRVSRPLPAQSEVRLAFSSLSDVILAKKIYKTVLLILICFFVPPSLVVLQCFNNNFIDCSKF
jgi:hypothetical protein